MARFNTLLICCASAISQAAAGFDIPQPAVEKPSGLSAEAKAKIEANKRRAMERRQQALAQRQQQAQGTVADGDSIGTEQSDAPQEIAGDSGVGGRSAQTFAQAFGV